MRRVNKNGEPYHASQNCDHPNCVGGRLNSVGVEIGQLCIVFL